MSVRAKNIGSFRALDYEIQQGITTLVFGENKDNESQKSNGSGKSFLIECVVIGITGAPLRKVKNDEVINDYADEAEINMEFSNPSSDERFFITRRLFRKDPTVIELESRVKLGTASPIVLSGVDEYNKFILEKLGISREELLNTFLLSKHKYENFLSASDKDKKEIINRFSNGVIVDKAIEQIEQDRQPVRKELENVKLEQANSEGRMSALEEQINTEIKNREYKERGKAERITSLKEAIAQKRKELRENQEKLPDLEERSRVLDDRYNQMVKLEDTIGSLPVIEGLNILTEIGEGFGYTLKDWKTEIDTRFKEMETCQHELQEASRKLPRVEAEIQNVQEELSNNQTAYTIMNSEVSQQKGDIQFKKQKLEKELDDLIQEGKRVKASKENLQQQVAQAKLQLMGAIVCPNCSHQFIAASPDTDVENLTNGVHENEEQVELMENELAKARTKVKEIESEIGASFQKSSYLEQQVREAQKSVTLVEDKLQTLSRSLKQLKESIEYLSDRLKKEQKKIDDTLSEAINDIFSQIDKDTKVVEQQIDSITCKIPEIEGAIKMFSELLEEVLKTPVDRTAESLKESLQEYRKKLSEIVAHKATIEKRMEEFNIQESRFVEFKTYLANTKIKALSEVMNGFLETIGSDLRVRFSECTVLKSGKVRDKISISLLRDGIEVGSFGKFSEGEKARINLASVLAMHKLINLNCDEGKGLDLLVLDEILEAVDENGLSSMFSALNSIGITSLVISHGNVAENYPHILLITKENGESTIYDKN